MKAEIELSEEIVNMMVDRIIEKIKPVISSKKEHEDDIIFNIKEVATYLKVNPSWVYKKVSLKEIPHFHTGKYPKFRKSQIDKWIVTQSVKAVPNIEILKKY